MRTKCKLLIAKIWCLSTGIIMVTSLLMPMVTKSGQFINEPLALVGCSMAMITCYVYEKYGAIQ
jgi:hypothetical protein